MVMLTTPFTALLALLTAASSLALPTNPSQAHLATQPLIEATLLEAPPNPIADHSGAKNDLVNAWVGRLRGRVASPKRKDGSKSPNAIDNSTPLSPPSALGGTVSKSKGNHTKEKGADGSESEGKTEKKKSGKKHSEDGEHEKRIAPERYFNSSADPLLDVEVNLSRSMTRMMRRHWHWYSESPDVIVVDRPSHDIVIDGGDSDHIHIHRRHHHEHVHEVSDHHGEVKDIDIDRKRRGVGGNFGPASAPWKRDTGSPGMIDIFSSSTKVASLVLEQTNDTSGNTVFVMNASSGNNTGTLLKMVTSADNSSSTSASDTNTTTVNFQMLPPNPDIGVLCMTFDPNPSSALPMTAEPCDNNVTLHHSQLFSHNAGTGAIAPMWNTSSSSSPSKRQQPTESPSGAQNVTLIFTPAVESAQPSNKELIAAFLPGNGTTSSSSGAGSGDSQNTTDGSTNSSDEMTTSTTDPAAAMTTSTDSSTDSSSTSTSLTADSLPTDTTDPDSIYQEDVMTSNAASPSTTSASFLTATATATETTDVTATQTPVSTDSSTGQSSADVSSSSPTPTGAQQSFEWMFNAGM